MNWLNLSIKKQQNLFEQISYRTGILPQAIEKDAWVTLILRMLFSSEVANHLTFKGGTSLSKVYHLINRFSEDIDINISREYLGFPGEITKGQIRKLRRASHKFVSERMPEILEKQLDEYGIFKDKFEIIIENKEISDQDPETILIRYKSVFNEISYLANRVIIEIGARSSNKPMEKKKIKSIIDKYYEGLNIAEFEFDVIVICPEKTFLEKLILLHEEFSKPANKVRYYRMSRHLYDIAQIIETEYGKKALKDKKLFYEIIEHRKKFTPVKTVDYENLEISKLNIFPNGKVLNLYRKDFNSMQENMIYGEKQKFDEIINKIKKYLF